MVLAFVVPFQWDIAIPGVVLFLFALVQAASGATYSGSPLDLVSVVIAAIGVIMLASCSLTVFGILRRRARLTLCSACIYTCQSALFFSGLQILFADPSSLPRLVHPAVLLMLSGLGPVWLLPRLSSAYHATVREVRLLCIIVLALSGAMALVFGLLPMGWGVNDYLAMVVWIVSLALSLVVSVLFNTSFPAHRVRVARPSPATSSR